MSEKVVTHNSSTMFLHTDVLEKLSEDIPLQGKLATVHHYVREHFPAVDRIAVALYDADTDMLKTFAHSSIGDNPLPLYEARLATSHSLSEIVRRRQPRLVNDLDFLGPETVHAKRILAEGYGSSYTMPIFRSGEFIGFLFFNSLHKAAFGDESLHYFDLLGHLLALMVIDSLATAKTLVASVRSATGMAQHRNFETGTHLDRMAHYARLIAREIAPKYGLDDATVEQIFLFSPLHDIGKIGIPDEILLKRGKLDAEEYAVMKTHSAIGYDIIESMLSNFHIDGSSHTSILRNIALYHHEAMNGSGYPRGIQGDQIPIEARIAAVADVFDALTSARPYKDAWTIDDAFCFLTAEADSRFDRDCVAALIDCRAEVQLIREKFAEKNGRG